MNSKTSPARRRQAGFTLIELAISMIVIVEVLLGVLLLFDFTNKLSHAQTNIADMQQSLRVAQSEVESLLRMSGRGELKFSPVTPGQALWVRDNVPANSIVGGAGSPLIVTGTDVLTVRGVFATPLYQINAKDKTTIVFRDATNAVTTDPTVATTVTLTVSNISPTYFTQNLQPLADALAAGSGAGIPEALVLKDASNFDNYAVVELIPGPTNSTVTATQAVLKCRIRGTAANLVDSYTKLGTGGTYPAKMTSVMSVGILEEYRFYVRQYYAIANNAASEPTPKLARARFMPGTDIPYGPNPALANNLDTFSLDLADNIQDMQVALGFDTINHVARTQPPGSPAEPAGLTTIVADPVNGYISEAANGQNDDWLYNSTADLVTDPVWANVQAYYARVSFLARTDRRDWKYEAPLLGAIEDRTYLSTDPLNLANSAVGSTQQRQYRRRILQTVIDVRNL
jgi:type II secretory pathway pseudopilin PulG